MQRFKRFEKWNLIGNVSLMLIFTFSIMLITNAYPLYSQDEDVAGLINKAEKLYEYGKYQEGLSLLDKTRNMKRSDEELSKIYFIYSLLYYADGFRTKAGEYLMKVLKYEKDKTLSSEDYTEGFIRLLNEVKSEYNKEIVTKQEERGKIKQESKKKVITKIGKKKKKKKFPALLVLVGFAAIVTAFVLLVGRKDKTSTTTHNYVQEVYDSMEWVEIPAGSFKMGDNFDVGLLNEQPVHTVYLDRYYISKYEVKFEQYDIFCEETGKSKPSDNGWGRGNRPVINVSWYDAKGFCDWLSKGTGKKISLPTEAEWEKAARGTDQRKYPWGNSSPNSSRCNYDGNLKMTMPVGSYPLGVSPYGIYNMAGNVWEWCSDWFNSSYYSSSPTNNPTGPLSGYYRVFRGGSLYDDAFPMRTAYRNPYHPSHGYCNIGFRLAKTD